MFEELLDVLMFIVVIDMLYTLEDQPFKIRNFTKSTIFEVENSNHQKLETIILIVFDFQG